MRIATREVHVSLGGAHILKGINLAADTAEFIGVIGPNGSGKSTLLRCIYRVLQPSEGKITLDNKALDSYKMKESARRMAVVSQHNYHSFDFTVREVVLMGRAPHKKTLERDNPEDYRIVHEALAKVDMLAYEERSFSTLSGGEQQRIILARALAQQTPCLVLDEPTNHLDIKYQLQLMDIVKRLDVTVISAIHDLNIAAMYCDRIIALNKGKVIAEGSPEVVLTPEFIRDVYEVDSMVSRDDNGLLHIHFYPPNESQVCEDQV